MKPFMIFLIECYAMLLMQSCFPSLGFNPMHLRKTEAQAAREKQHKGPASVRHAFTDEGLCATVTRIDCIGLWL
jgi:hypothetical protein